MASLHYHEPPRDISLERVSATPLQASITRHGTRVNHACPPRLAFPLDVELGRETFFHGDLATLVLHTLVETSLVARISVVHQSSKPEQHMLGSIELHHP